MTVKVCLVHSSWGTWFWCYQAQFYNRSFQLRIWGPKSLTQTIWFALLIGEKSCMVHVSMLKSYVKRDSDLLAVKPSLIASSVVDEFDQDFSVPCGRLTNFAILNDLSLNDLSSDQKRNIIELIENHRFLFSDISSQITVLTHEIDVGDARLIKQLPYRLNPKKCDLIKPEVEYLR